VTLDDANGGALSAPSASDVAYDNDEVDPHAMASESYARAAQDVSDRFTHELQKMVGQARLHATQQLQDEFEGSDLARDLTRMADFLHGIRRLSDASSSPVRDEVDVARLVQDEADGVCAELGVGLSPPVDGVPERTWVEPTGPSPLVVLADAGLVRLALANGLRNAIEASLEVGAKTPVVVSWGETDKDLWLAVIDRAGGIPAGSSQVFAIGATSKRGHMGLGLATAQQAVWSHGGTLELEPREDGTTFRICIPLRQEEV
jgi:signal transduction histidine kinase